MRGIEIRPTIPTDLDALADVLVQVHELDGYPVEGVDEPRAWVELPEALGQWTALLDGQPVGHAALLRPAASDSAPGLLARQEHVPPTQIAVLGRLFVAPGARGRAIAHELMEAAEVKAGEAGLSLVLDVMLKDETAIGLYKRRGWRILGQFEHVHAANRRVSALGMASPPLKSVHAQQFTL